MSAELSTETSSLGEADLLAHLMANIPDRIYFKDRQSRFIRMNPAMARRFGLADPAEAVGLTDFDIHSPEHAREALADERRIIRTGEPLIGKVEKVVLPDGKPGWALSTKMPLRDAHGRIAGTFGITRDYTELKQAQDDVANAHDALRKSYEELQQAQLQLIEAEKMSSIGRLASGLAHEINNPLAVIKMGVDCLASAGAPTEQDETFPAVLQTISDAVAQADAMIKRLQAFAAPRGLTLEKCDIHALIVRALELLAHEIEAHVVTVYQEFDPALPEAAVDDERITQVLVHLLSNALGAMPEGGGLTVRTRAFSLDAADCAQGEFARDEGDRSGLRFRVGDRLLAVEIEDTGAGIPEEDLRRIFEPFFTTKPTGQGTGLGLTVSRKVMELHAGLLTIGNREEGGARAALYLKL